MGQAGGVPSTEAELTIVYTDGACSGNPGPGGWGWAVSSGPSASGGERQSTNQRMEMRAVYEALQVLLGADDSVGRTATGRVRVVSDSTYVVNCFKQRWWANWERNGWRNSQKQPVANQDLWKPLVELVKANSARIEFVWVKGHSGNPMNDLVDRLAVAAAKEIVLTEPMPLSAPTGESKLETAVERSDTPQDSLF